MMQKELQHGHGPPDRAGPPQQYGPPRGGPSPPKRTGGGGYSPRIGEEEEYHHPRPDPTNQRQPPIQNMFPRFSTVSSVGSDRDRDSMISDSGSTIMGGFSFGFEKPDLDLQQGPARQGGPYQQQQRPYEDRGRQMGRPMMMREEMPPLSQPHLHQIRMAMQSDPRDSMRPTIETASNASDSRPNSIVTGPPTTNVTLPTSRGPPPPRQENGRRPSPDPTLNRQVSGTDYYRARSQPPKPRQPPVRQNSSDVPPRTDSKRTSPGSYIAYRAESPINAVPPQFPPPQNRPRQGSEGSYKGSPDGSERLGPYRQSAAGPDPRRPYPPPRQNSGSSAHNIPAKQGSGDSVQRGPDGRFRGSPSPQPPGSILPMMQEFRSASPESFDHRDSVQSNNTVRPPAKSFSSANGPEMARSTSAASQYSLGGTLLPKPAYNFSRPMSSRPSVDSGRPNIDTNAAQAHPSDDLPTPRAPHAYDGEPSSPQTDDPEGGAAPTVVYSRYALPRGRNMNQRDSVIFQDLPPDLDSLHQQVVGSSRPSTANPTPHLTPAKNQPPPPMNRSISQPARSPAAAARQPPIPEQPRPQTSKGPVKIDTRNLPPSHPNNPNSAISPRTPRPAASMTPDEHLDLGIELHEKGSLQESTYHLRCSAHGGHPTGMLMYALACRHGWGMRPNPKEGVSWLKKVTQIASADIENAEKGGKTTDFMERKAMKAQFALSIYELGISHRNGWGTDKDQALALNCFEIAGSKFLSISP